MLFVIIEEFPCPNNLLNIWQFAEEHVPHCSTTAWYVEQRVPMYNGINQYLIYPTCMLCVHVCVSVCACMQGCVCMYVVCVCMHECVCMLCECMYAWVCACMHVCVCMMHLCMSVCACMHEHVCMYMLYVCLNTCVHLKGMVLNVELSVQICPLSFWFHW